jgi:hypothetical protein
MGHCRKFRLPEAIHESGTTGSFVAGRHVAAQSRAMSGAASPSAPPPYARRYSTTVLVNAAVQDVFALVDDHSRLAAHMTRRSWMMGGGSMQIEADAGEGKTVGSRLKLHGAVLGVRLSIEEAITERAPPVRKAWATIGEPRLLVIGRYRMGFDLQPDGRSSQLAVFIEYDLPAKAPWRWLGALFSGAYARWCTERMAKDAARHFGSSMKRGSA